LALIAGVGLFALIRSRVLLIGIVITGLLATAVLSPVRDRVFSLVDSAQSVLTETYTLPDASARHRFGSWEEGWQLFLDKPLIGQGYNRYGDAALELGTIKDTNIHSANGSDSSLLTVLATTGLLGFLPFIAIYGLILRWAWRDREIGLIGGITGLFVHSIFVNSLLFPLLLAPLWILIGSRLRSGSPIR
jgi:O-antigen ligase